MSSPVVTSYPLSDNPRSYTGLPRQKAAGARLCVGLVVDISDSTKDVKEDIRAMLNETVRKMQNTLLLQNMVRLIVLCYNHTTSVLVDEDLEKITEDMLRLPKPNGATDTGRAILYMLRLMDEKKKAWKEKDKVTYLQPLLFLFTDGFPSAGTITGESDEQKKERERQVAANYQAAAAAIREREKAQKLTFVAGGFQREGGESADMAKLCELTEYPKDSAFRLINAGSAKGSDTLTLESFFSKLHVMTCNTAKNGVIETPSDDMYAEIMR